MRKQSLLVAGVVLAIGFAGTVYQGAPAAFAERTPRAEVRQTEKEASARSPLPAGYGLAAKYPGDRGIARDPHILFAENFEAGDFDATLKRWTEVSNQEGKVLAFSRDIPSASAGKRSLQMTATLGENTGGHLFKLLPRGVDTLYARFYVRFAADTDYIHHFVHLGGNNPPTRWPTGGAGTRPRGDDRVTMGIEPHVQYGQFSPPGAWSFYNYWPEMKISADGKYWGNAIRPEVPPIAPRGRWQCVEVMLKLNSAPDEADGEQALWLDGKRIMHVRKGARRGKWSGMGFDLLSRGGEPFEGFRWRASNDLKINYFWLQLYVTEGAAQQNKITHPNRIHRVWFDDIVLSTAYIGPTKKAAQNGGIG